MYSTSDCTFVILNKVFKCAYRGINFRRVPIIYRPIYNMRRMNYLIESLFLCTFTALISTYLQLRHYIFPRLIC